MSDQPPFANQPSPLRVPSAYLQGSAAAGLTAQEPPEGSQGNINIPSIYTPTNEPQKPPEKPGGVMGRSWQRLVPFGDQISGAMDAAESLGDYIQGDKRTQYPDTPNLFESTDGQKMNTAKALPLLVGYALNARPDQLQHLAQQAMPGSEIFTDDKGNPMIRHEGRTYYVSKPGLRMQDLISTFGEGAVQAAAAFAATRFGLPRNMASPGAIRAGILAGAQGVSQGLAKLGTGEAVRQMGGGTGSDPVELALATLGGAGGSVVESTVRGVAARLRGQGALLFHGIAGVPDDTLLTPGNLTETGRTLLGGIVQPGQLTVGQARQIQRTLGQVVTEAGRQDGRPTVARAVQSAREDIPMTAGQLTGSPDQLYTEKNLRIGAGRQVMDAMDAAQREALTRAAGNRLPDSGSPHATTPPNPWAPSSTTPRPAGAAPPSRLELGDALERGLRQRGDALAAGEAHAWSGLERATPAGERTVPNGLLFHEELATRFRARRAIDRLEETPPLPQGRVQQAEALMDDALFRANAQGQSVPNEIDLGRFKQLRQTLGRMAADTTSPEERRTLQRMQRGLDDVTNQTVADGMISGDATRLTQLRDAQRASRQEFAFWEPNNPSVARFMAKLRAGDMPGEQVYRALFGAGRLNAGGPANQIIEHLERQFGQNSTMWADVQRAAVRSALFGDTDQAFNPQRMIAEIDKALEGPGAGILRRLGISPDNLRELQRTAETLNQSASRNKSGTSGDVWELIRSKLATIPFARKLVDNSLQVEARARMATGAGAGARLRPSDFTPEPGRFGPRVGLLGAPIGAEALPPSVRERGR